jgi:hypothetical protein
VPTAGAGHSPGPSTCAISLLPKRWPSAPERVARRRVDLAH